MCRTTPHLMGDADDLLSANQAVHAIARIEAIGVGSLNVVAAGGDRAGCDRFERLARAGARFGEADGGRIDEHVLAIDPDRIAGQARDAFEEPLAFQVRADLAALEAKHDQIAALDRRAALEHRQHVGQARREIEQQMLITGSEYERNDQVQLPALSQLGGERREPALHPAA